MGTFDRFKPNPPGTSSTSRAPTEAELLLARREIHIAEAIDDFCANSAIAQLLFLQMQDPAQPVSLLVDSPGGALTAGLAILDTICFLTPPVHTRTETGAYGLALWLLTAGKKGHRLIAADAILSIEPSQFYGDHCNLETAARIHDSLADKLAGWSNLPKTEILTALQGKGRRFTAQEAIAAGLVDGMIPGMEEKAAPWTLY